MVVRSISAPGLKIDVLNADVDERPWLVLRRLRASYQKFSIKKTSPTENAGAPTLAASVSVAEDEAGERINSDATREAIVLVVSA